MTDISHRSWYRLENEHKRLFLHVLRKMQSYGSNISHCIRQLQTPFKYLVKLASSVNVNGKYCKMSWIIKHRLLFKRFFFSPEFKV